MERRSRYAFETYTNSREDHWCGSLFVCLLLILLYACQTPQPLPPPQPPQKPDAADTFKGAAVAPKQILIKLSSCEGVESKQLTEAVRKFSAEVTRDSGVAASRGAIGCWFLIKSSTLTTQELMTIYDHVIAEKRSVKVGELIAVIIHHEPDFLLRIDRPVKNLPLRPPAAPSPSESAPNDHLFLTKSLWGHKNYEHPGIDIHAEEAWNHGTGSRSIAVGVIDSGIAYNHPDLVEGERRNVWSAPEDFDVTVGDEVIHCPKGSHGYNAVPGAPDLCDPMDKPVNESHGTHVAGIIGALGNNGIGTVGVNWNTTIIGLKAVNEGGEAPVDDVVKVIKFAIAIRERFGAEANTRVLNASFGYRVAADPALISTYLREQSNLPGLKTYSLSLLLEWATTTAQCLTIRRALICRI